MDFYIFDNIKKDKILSSLLKFKQEGSEKDYYKAARGLIGFSPRRVSNSGIIAEYAVRAMLERDGLPSLVELRDYLRHDAKLVYKEFLAFDWDAAFEKSGLLPLQTIGESRASLGLSEYVSSVSRMCECSSSEAFMGALLGHIEEFGTGKTSVYSALRWESGRLRGIEQPDDITFSRLTGLGFQKKTLIANTEAFVCGRKANDVLLTGSSGTGKSSSVKACLNMFKARGLRLIEVGKSDIGELPKVFEAVKNSALRYIIFIDDLSFEPDDMSYKILKVALDGQAEARGDNILIYATSNRSSLIKETWSEREGYISDEVHRNEGLAERKSLSERFGIKLSFLSPTQEEYLNIISDMLKEKNIEMTDEIRQGALMWQTRYNGFSGRTARQFVTDILAQS